MVASGVVDTVVAAGHAQSARLIGNRAAGSDDTYDDGPRQCNGVLGVAA